MTVRLILTMVLVIVGKLAFAQKIPSGEIKFSELVKFIDSHTDYNFSYPNNLKNVAVTIDEKVDITNPAELSPLLQPYGIVLVHKGQLLIFKKSNSTKDSNNQPTNKQVVSGYIRDAESGESLIGAHVIDTETNHGVTSNIYGFFSISTAGDSLAVSFIGYKTLKLGISQITSGLELSLEKDQKILSEIVVSGERKNHEVSEMSTIDLAPKTVKKLPVFMGETDIMKAIQLLPGVQSGNEGTAGLYVRGGGPDQNLILLDGVPVYNANHLFGFFSVFNTDAINHVELIKGGFPARYGGRLSSVVDIQMKEGNLNKLEGEGAVGLVASKLTIGAPIQKGKTSYMVSARRTYVDLFTVPITRAANADPIFGYNFWDLNTKINHIFSPKDRIYLSAYLGRDKYFSEYTFDDDPGVREDEFSSIKWGNITSAFRWNHTFNDKLFGNLTTTFSRYEFELNTTLDYQYDEDVGTPDVFRENEYFSNIRDYALKLDFDYFANNFYQVKFGASITNHQLNPGISTYKSRNVADTTFGSTQLDLTEFYSYFENDITIANHTSLNLGVHFSGADAENTTYWSLQPRVSINQKLANNLSLKASYSRMAQFIHLLVNAGVGLPTDLWVPTTDLVKPQFSDQVAAGMATTIKGFDVTVEGYYKWMDNLIEYKEGAGFLDIDSNWEDKVEFGEGTSYGVELFVQKKYGFHTGWLGYTWSKTTREFENLNFGRPFPYRYDRRHDLSLVYNYELSEKVSIGAVWVYGTGNAVTLPTSNYPKATWDSNNVSYEGFIKNYPGRNSSRMKDYHRLDLSISFKKQTKWGERKWVFGVYNAYSRLNPTFIDFDDSNPLNKNFKQISLFPVIPNVSYQFKF